MRLIGLTGGIASGKSTVARMLARHGAVIVDADAIAREVVEPGKPAFDKIVARFGPHVVASDGTIDRTALAAIVFEDPAALADLNAITHPEVGVQMSERIERARAAGADIVVLDVPLLVEAGMADGLDAVLVVTAPPEQQIERLARDRGMNPDDARARIAAQAGEGERRAVATYVIENTGSLEELQAKVDDFWRRLGR